MPKIQNYSAQIQVNAPAPRQATAEDFGGDGGFGDLKQGFDDLLAYQKKQDAVEYGKVMSQFQLDTIKRQEELSVQDLPDYETTAIADFDQQAKALKIPMTMKEEFQADLNNLKLNVSKSVIETKINRVREQSVLDWQNTVTNEANAVALNPGYQGASIARLAEVAKSLPLDPVKRAELIDRASDEVRASAATAIADKSPGAFLSQAKSGKWNDLPNLQSVMNFADSKIKQAQAEVKQEVRLELDNIEQASSLGVQIPDKSLDSIAAKAKSLGMTREYENITQFKSIQTSVIDFVAKPLAEQQKLMTDKKSVLEAGDLSGVAEYKAISSAYDNKVKMVQSDPWAYYSAAKIIKPLAPLPLNNPQELQSALQSRRASVDLVRERDGVSMPLMNKEEINQLVEGFNTGKSKEVSQTLTMLGGSLQPDERRVLAQKFKESSPLVAAAFVQDRVTAEKILSGAKIEGAKVAKAALTTSLQTKLSNAVTDPEALNSIQDAVYAHYKFDTMQAGALSDGNIDDERLTAATEAVLGKTDSFSFTTKSSPVSTVILPKDAPGIESAGDIEDIFGNMNDAQLARLNNSAPFAGDGDPVSIDDLLSNGRFVTVGDGQYGIILDNLGKVIDKEGRDYVIDIRKMRDIQNGRN